MLTNQSSLLKELSPASTPPTSPFMRVCERIVIASIESAKNCKSRIDAAHHLFYVAVHQLILDTIFHATRQTFLRIDFEGIDHADRAIRPMGEHDQSYHRKP
jgi:hypothetical protein